MKKMLLVVALVAAAVVSNADARSCGKRRSCATKCETKSAPCEQVKCCIPAPCIVDCITNVCEGEMPQLCSLKPARVNAIKHVDTNIYYTCAERGPCEVIPTQAQVDALIGMDAVPADTVPCSR